MSLTLPGIQDFSSWPSDANFCSSSVIATFLKNSSSITGFYIEKHSIVKQFTWFKDIWKRNSLSPLIEFINEIKLWRVLRIRSYIKKNHSPRYSTISVSCINQWLKILPLSSSLEEKTFPQSTSFSPTSNLIFFPPRINLLHRTVFQTFSPRLFVNHFFNVRLRSAPDIA